MCQLIEKLACDKGINLNDANLIFTFISERLTTQIPEFSQVMEDLFENGDPEQLQEHISKAIQLIQQQQWKQKFKGRLMPSELQVVHSSGKGELF